MSLLRNVYGGEFIREWLDRLASIAASPEHTFKMEFRFLRTRAIAELAYSSGLLPHQLRKLPYSAADFDRLALILEDRQVPITEVAAGAIASWRARTPPRLGNEQGYLFFSIKCRDQPLTIAAHYDAIRDAGDAVGFRLTASDLRSAFIVEMKERGMSVEQLAYMTGLAPKVLATWKRK